MRKPNTLKSVLVITALIACATVATADFYKRAPDVLPWVKPEMMKKEFWIFRMPTPDKVLMTVNEIQAMNTDYERRMMAAPNPFAGVDPDRMPVQADLDRWPGRFVTPPVLNGLDKKRLAAVVRAEISHDIDFLRGKYLKGVIGQENVVNQTFGNILGIQYADWEIDQLEDEMALDRVTDDITPEYGITVCDAQLRTVPNIKMERVGIFDAGTARWDVWNANIVRIGTPVTMLAASRSGGYVFVLAPDGYGWIRSESVAIDSRGRTEGFLGGLADDGFIVCTGDMVPLYSDKRCLYTSGWLRMGDRLPLADPSNPRIVKIPVRLTDGRLDTSTAWLAPDAAVSVGYLPYTKRNVVELGFRMMGNPYDWSGGFMGRNHETWIRDAFACFGFRLPYHAELFTFFAGNDRVVRPEEGTKAQKAAISANESFVTIQTCGGGHCQLYLDTVDGEPYVLDTTGYGYTADDGSQIEIRRLTVCDMRIPQYFLKTTFTFCELSK